jgi:hypothetical protein
LLGDLPGWADGLAERRLELVDAGADTVVTTEHRLDEALRQGARALVVEGSRRAVDRMRDAGYDASRIVSLPLEGSPVLFVDLSRHNAARFAFSRGLGHAELWRTARNIAVGAAAGFGFVPPVAAAVAISNPPGEVPAFLAAAVQKLGLPAGSQWVMLVSPGSVVRRNAFLVFPPGSRTPQYAVKFARIRGLDSAFDREERGYGHVGHATRTLQDKAPRYLGRVVVDAFHVSAETAAVGTRLSTALRRPLPKIVKGRAVERVAQWLLRVARDTGSRGAALEEEWGELEASVLPRWLNPAQIATVTADLRATPATFQHNDLAEENVIVRRRDFCVVDWEWAQPKGLPFGDLVYFGVHVLRLVDGVADTEQDRHFRELLLGRAPSSRLFFGWTQALARELQLPFESVPGLVTLSWLKRAHLSQRERERAERAGGVSLQPAFAERAAEIWMRDPELGLAWQPWRP